MCVCVCGVFVCVCVCVCVCDILIHLIVVYTSELFNDSTDRFIQ